jgi:hypothetical protein
VKAGRERRLGVLMAGFVAVACAAAASVPSGTGQPRAARGARVLALSANAAATSRDPFSGIRLALRAGIRGAFLSDTWSTLERTSGKYSFGDLNGLGYLGDKLHLTLLLGIQVLNTTANEAPRDLQSVPFDSPALMNRFRRLLVAVRPYLNRHVEYLSIGNEVDVYLSAHPAQWDAYTRFYRSAVAEAHALAPWIKVGVTTTFDGLTSDAPRIRRLNSASDVQIMTYYPLGAHFAVRSPTSPLVDFRTMLSFTRGRPLVLQEVGYPSARRLNSSPTKQARFVRAVYRAWAQAGSRIPFLNFFLLHDLTRPTCEQLGRYYGLSDENFLAYLCSLGLRRADGSPKPAWTAFVDGAARVASQQTAR